ncbi:MAG: ABC transporter transmembrane domain-containing protein [Gammaproteobacteria bacterium]|nr:ABC transporter transmembrane domain-containing protein [Gammaproteobacteria bacterium]
MEPSLYRYIWQHSSKSQIFLIILSVVSLPLVYITLELPKQIINLLEGLPVPSSLFGYELDRLTYLMLLSLAFLLVVLCSGGLKYLLNVFRGSLGEHVLRRFRYELYQRLLRFPVPHFKRVSQGEIIPMITAETEPLGEFIGESFTLPVFQGGILLTYLFFIFQQDVFLGLAAIALYPFQLYVIPKLQKRVNELSKQRVVTARDLSGRIGETISGINDVHANDTSHFERAHIGQRLGRIYLIRFDIYKRKFFIKFLNNFIAQLTPFFFYSVGGYFVLRGDLSIGSMVAVLVAYKDLSGPWKELLRYYQRKEDIKVKYTQIIGQFQPQNMLEPAIIDRVPESLALPGREITAANLRYSEDGLYFSIDGASFRFPLDCHSAAVGLGNSGKDELAFMMSRLIVPSSGSMTIGDTKMSELPEAITGKRLGYVGPAVFLFNGSVFDNLCYALKHQPVKPATESTDKQIARERHLAREAGNTPDRYDDEWIDYAALGLEDSRQLNAQLIDVLACVELDDEVYQFGLLSFVDQADHVQLASRIMQARRELRGQFDDPAVARLVEPFDLEKYNLNMTVSENLLFGTVYDDEIDLEQLINYPAMLEVLETTGLYEDLLQAGLKITEIMLDLFSDVEPDSELFEQFSFISADDLPEFNQLLQEARKLGTDNLPQTSQRRLISLSFKLIVARHRLGLIDQGIQQKILDARKKIHAIAAEKDLGIEFFDASQYNPRVSIQDNILFGKLAYGQANAQQKINALIADVVDSLDLRNDIIAAGLAYEVGVAGGRLSAIQRQKLGLARALLKRPDLLIVNEALAGLDSASERRLIANVRREMGERGILWVLGRVQLADQFDHVMVMERGRVVDQGSYGEIEQGSDHFRQLLAAE